MRIINGLRQVELAEKIGMEPSNLCKLENGCQMPKEENLEKIAKVLNVEIKDLFDFNKNQTSESLITKINLLMEKASNKDLECFYDLLKTFLAYKRK